MRALLPLALLVFSVAPRAEITVHDDRGRNLVLPAPAQRIVSLAPSLTELLFTAGAGSRLVGTAAFSDYPPEAGAVPVIGDSAALDVERIVALKPDLVLAWQSGNPPAVIAELERLGLRVLVTEPGSLQRIAREIEILGRVAGTVQTAEQAAARFRWDMDALRNEYRGRRRVTVFYQVWSSPLMTLNGKHVISEVIDLCGGENIFAGLQPLVPRVSLEAVIAADPEAIVAAAKPAIASALGNWHQWRQLRAVRAGNLIVIPADDLSRPTPRLLKGARRLCAALDQVRR